MEDPDVLAYCQKLADLGIENMILEHLAERNPAIVAESLGLTPADCVPTLLMNAKDHFIAVVIRGDSRANFKKIKKLLGLKDLRMATPDEFTEFTGLPLGAARVYNPGVQTILDSKLFEKEFLTGGSGRFDCSVKIRTEDLKKLPDSMVAEISE